MLKEQDFKTFEALPPSTTCRLIDFDKVQIVPGFVPKTFFLIVSGVKPWATMQVELRPRIFIVQPDYWESRSLPARPESGFPTRLLILLRSKSPTSSASRGSR